MGWMWLVIIALYAYHGWCLQSGKVRFTRSDGVTRRSTWLYRSDNQTLYWIVWGGGAATTTIFTIYMLIQPAGTA